MRFVTIRDFRSKAADIQRRLPREKEIVLTSNGRPIAIISSVREDTVEKELLAIRRARAEIAVARLQEGSPRAGLDHITRDEIEREISFVRKGMKK